MKKLTLSLLLLLCGNLAAQAQDIIVKINADSIRARILEISPENVRYKRASNPDGPTYVLPVAQISSIVYANGERDIFNETITAAAAATEPARPAAPATSATTTPVQPATTAPAAPATPAATAPGQPAPTQPAEDKVVYRQRPEIGKIYDDNGVRGIVLSIDSDGMHGLMLSLVQAPHYLPWSTLRNPVPATVATDKSDGAANMAAIERYIAENSLSWDAFPAFKWCRDLGNGWYLPAIDEVILIGFRYNGSQRTVYNRKARISFNEELKDNGGKKLDPLVDYYSSTDMGDCRIATGTMDINPPYTFERPGHEKYLVRAVRRF